MAQSKFLSLQCGAANNYLQWVESCGDCFGPTYGILATSLFDDNVPYLIPAVVEADYMPPVVEGVAPLSNAHLALLRVDAEKSRGRKVRAMADLLSKLFADIWASMSQDSRVIVKAHADWATASTVKNANILYRIIRETHCTHVQGGGPAMRALEKQRKMKAFRDLTQTAEMSLPSFKKLWEDHQTVLTGLGVAAGDPYEQAIEFLQSLDMARYGEMIKDLRNGAARGVELPQTVQAAYEMAAVWTTEVKPRQGKGANMQSVFVLSDDAVGTDAGAAGTPPPKPRQGKGANMQSVFVLSDDAVGTDAGAAGTPPPKPRQGKGANMQSVFVLSDDAVGTDAGAAGTPPPNQKAWAGRGMLEKKIAHLEKKLAEAEKRNGTTKEADKCWWCYSAGHRKHECSEYAEYTAMMQKRTELRKRADGEDKQDGRVMIAQGLDDEADEEALYDVAMAHY
jgi:hypothetical protein